jgi:hypothetical protein
LSEENEIFENTAKDYLLSYLISENNVKIYEFNRLVKDLNGFVKSLAKVHHQELETATVSTKNINLECILTMNSIV